ncbi:MAG: hypothetical protein HOO67_06235 [Candidatus Peribacteraceae bacterium]|nr:hypothetical protein [Candidatus Peribacteraceae bacterium]
MKDFVWTLLFAPFVAAYLWQLGGADVPQKVNWLEGKYWRRFGVPLFLAFNSIACSIFWGVTAIAAIGLCIAASEGYGKLIDQRNWKALWLLGLRLSVPALILTISAGAWLWVPICALPAVVWVGSVWLSNHPSIRMPWKLAEGLTGFSAIAACVPAWIVKFL